MFIFTHMTKKILFVCLGIGSLFFLSCKKNPVSKDAFQFRKGTFEIPEGNGYSKTILIRKDSLQIEIYEDRTDTLQIEWQNNFKYTLKMLHPKTTLDKSSIHVKITNVEKNRYDFVAKIGYSNFEQKGTVYKHSNQEPLKK